MIKRAKRSSGSKNGHANGSPAWKDQEVPLEVLGKMSDADVAQHYESVQRALNRGKGRQSQSSSSKPRAV